MDSMKQQMLELCRSDTLSKARQQHDRDLAIIKEQHEAALLTLEQKLDSTAQALSEQVCSVTVTGDTVAVPCRHSKLQCFCVVASRLMLVRGYESR